MPTMSKQASNFTLEVWVHLMQDNRIVNAFTDHAPIIKADEDGNEYVDYYGERLVHEDNKVFVPVSAL